MCASITQVGIHPCVDFLLFSTTTSIFSPELVLTVRIQLQKRIVFYCEFSRGERAGPFSEIAAWSFKDQRLKLRPLIVESLGKRKKNRPWHLKTAVVKLTRPGPWSPAFALSPLNQF
jgi:hypothetical protein